MRPIVVEWRNDVDFDSQRLEQELNIRSTLLLCGMLKLC